MQSHESRTFSADSIHVLMASIASLQIINDLSFPLDVNDRDQMVKIVMSCIGTKFTSRYGTLMAVSSWRRLQCFVQPAAEEALCWYTELLKHLLAAVFLQDLALEAVSCITNDLPGGRKEIDVKKYAKVEKLPGGQIEDSRVLKVRGRSLIQICPAAHHDVLKG